MKNYLKINLSSHEYLFPYLGFILDEDGVEHDFGQIIPEVNNGKIDNYRHSCSLAEKVKELYPEIDLDGMDNNLVDITSELAANNLITYLNLSGEELVSDGMLQVGQSPTLKQRAALREYNNFFKQHIGLPIHHFYEENNYETYYMDIDEFLDMLYEEEYTRGR